MLLGQVVRTIAEAENLPSAPVTVRAAKFLSPLRPGEAASLTWQAPADGVTRFACAAEASGAAILSGTLSWTGR